MYDLNHLDLRSSSTFVTIALPEYLDLGYKKGYRIAGTPSKFYVSRTQT